MSKQVSVISVLFAALAVSASASDLDEFKLKRKGPFEFAQKPTVSRDGDRITIRFASKGYCDATVAVEDGRGRIVRHLACGVLGPNAPAPFQKDSKRQMLVWDGKDDQGAYIDDKENHTVRVSLGLDPKFERALFWEPKKRTHQWAPCMQATAEGVYVYDGRVLDHVCLFDHEGNYVRTVYPFPADKVKKVKGLHWRRFPQDGAERPVKEGFHQSTLLTCGRNAGFEEKIGIGIDRHNNWHGSVWGNAASVMAVRDGRMALAQLRLNRLATDGTSGGLELTGPEVTFPIMPKGDVGRGRLQPVPPRSAAFSPDGRWLYLTGYVFGHGQSASRDIVLVKFYDWLPGVARLDFERGGKAEVFLGGMKLSQGGTDEAHFRTPTSVAVDAAGRIYVTDFANNRVQVFAADGRLLKSIKAKAPAQVAIHHKTQQIYVFSWQVPNLFTLREEQEEGSARTRVRLAHVEPALTVLNSFDDPTPALSCPLPLGGPARRGSGMAFRAALDSWADPPTLWLVGEWGRQDIMTHRKLKHTNIKVYALDGGRLKLKRDFNEDARKSVARTAAPEYFRQRLYVNPATGLLYVGEGEAAVGKSFRDLVQVNPETGKVKIVALPFDAEDMCFDANGLAYLRTFYLVARYDPATWREVPWDYGEEHKDVRTSSSRDARPAVVSSAIRLPVKSAGLHHHGGMAISPRGHLAVAVNNAGVQPSTRKDIYDVPAEVGGTPYTPRVFPGRVRWGEVHVWDRHGKMVYEDAVPGLNRLDGLGIDKDDNLYVLSTTTRILSGRLYFNDMTGTLFKVAPRKVKLLSPSDRASVQLSEPARPERAPDVFNGHVGRAWVEGAQWLYGGVGFSGKNAARTGGGCDCYNAHFALDDLGRSFAPEIGHCSVAVLDTNGNLILRVGQYGNADSAGPDSLVPLGGDEVGLFYAPYVATHTDRRLFIADPGNARVLSVKLDYHATERVGLGKEK